MELGDKLEMLKYFSETHRGEFIDRRKYEYRLVLTTLTFYVLSVAALGSGKVHLPPYWAIGVTIWVLFMTIAYVMTQLLKDFHVAQAKNKKLAEWAEDNITALVSGKTEFDPVPTREDLNKIIGDAKPPVWQNWAWRSQRLMLYTFAILSAFIITFDIFKWEALNTKMPY